MPDTDPSTFTDAASNKRPDGHPTVRHGKVGVLLVNLGTPDAADYWSVRRYLSEFLSDRRVIERSPLLWQPILQSVILTVRPSKSARAYREIWLDDAGSPLLHYTKRQTERLAERMAGPDLLVDFAMRYGNPSIVSKLGAMKEAGCDRINIVALYPQYSGTTTASVYDKVFDGLSDMRWQPVVRTTPAFHDDPAYIDALSASLERGLAALDFKPDALLLSYHGIPKSYFDQGDPYYCHCMKTTRLVRERFEWSEDFCRATFQSRFGPTEWLRPYTDETLRSLVSDGVKRVAVAAPAFVSDCLETLEELAIRSREMFLAAGGEKFAALPCLNDSDGAIDMIETLVRREIAGWIA